MSITLNSLVFPFAGFIQGGIARYMNTDAGVAAGFRPLTATVTGPNVNSDYKVRWKLVLPTVVQAGNGCCDVAERLSTVDIVVTVPRSAGADERTAMGNSIKDLVASPEFLASISSLITPSA